MEKDQVLGWIVLLGSVVGIVVYFYLTFLSPWVILTIQVSAFLAVAAVLAIVAWIGYTLATTPAPAPLEDIGDLDLETDTLEEEDESKEEK